MKDEDCCKTCDIMKEKGLPKFLAEGTCKLGITKAINQTINYLSKLFLTDKTSKY